MVWPVKTAHAWKRDVLFPQFQLHPNVSFPSKHGKWARIPPYRPLPNMPWRSGLAFNSAATCRIPLQHSGVTVPPIRALLMHGVSAATAWSHEMAASLRHPSIIISITSTTAKHANALLAMIAGPAAVLIVFYRKTCNLALCSPTLGGMGMYL